MAEGGEVWGAVADVWDGEVRGWGLFTEADVLDLRNGRDSVVSAGAPVCSNMPIKDVVGGIGVISNRVSKLDLALCVEGGLRSRPEYVRVVRSMDEDD